MFSNPDELFELTDALTAFGELEQNTDASILAMRSSERVNAQCRMLVRPANASERQIYAIEGVTADVSTGGCKAIMSRPVMTGDFFMVSFTDYEDEMGLIVARCRRCRMIQEDAYETGFQFVREIDVSPMVAD